MPGHSNIRGNETADASARAGLSQLPQPDTVPRVITTAYLRRLMNQKRQELLDNWWNKACPFRYKDLELQMRLRKPPELNLPRRLLHALIASRTGHGNFAEYHRRFHHEDANLECACGKETNPTHFIRCQNHRYLARKFTRHTPHGLLVKKLLGPKSLTNFTNFARETGCFGSLKGGPSSALSEDRDE